MSYDELKSSPTDYTWGPIVEFHEVGPYRIVGYHPHKRDGAVITRKPDRDKILYHPFIEAKSLIADKTPNVGKDGLYDTCCSYESLDAAIVGAIARRCDGSNTRADRYFILLLDKLAEGWQSS